MYDMSTTVAASPIGQKADKNENQVPRIFDNRRPLRRKASFLVKE